MGFLLSNSLGGGREEESLQWSLYDLSIYVQILKVLIADWPIQLDTCQISGTQKTRHFRKPSLACDVCVFRLLWATVAIFVESSNDAR